MMEISVNTTRAELIPPREPLTPGMVNAVQIKFTFSDEWNGLEKTCVFSNELESVPAIIESDIVSVPTEVLDVVYRWISVGVTGEDSEGNVVIPTIWCRIGQCLPGVSGKFVTIDQLQAYWSKQEVMFELDGDGTRFFGDDGQYHYVAQGGGDVTHEQLEAAIAPLAVKDDVDAALAEKADASALADYATVAALDAKADKTELADYYAKSDITLTTSGTGDKFLADDGTYKTVQGGGGGVTREELDAAIAPLATTAATDAALALKADKTELGSYAKQYDVNQALATKADKTEIAGLASKTEVETALAGKADNATLTNYALKSELPDTSQFASKSDLNLLTAEVADKADKSEIITVSDGDGTKFLADDGTYKTVQGADEKTFVAEYNVTTAQEIIEYLDAAKEPFAPMLVKRGADYYTVTTAAKQDANKVIIRTFATLSGNYYMFTYTITDNTWASSSYGFQKLLESGTNIKTINGQSLLGSGDIPISSAAQVQANWTETDDTSPAYIQNKPTIPDVSSFETTAHAEATYATKTELAAKADSTAMDTALAEKADADDVNAALALKADKTEIITKIDGTGTLFLADDGTYKPAAGDPPDLSAYLTKTEAAGEYATKTELAGKADAADIPDVSGFETTAHAEATYATKTELADKADSATVTALSGVVTGHTAEIAALQTGKADKSEIPDVSGFETTSHAAETYATKSELTDGLADKADATAIADMLTKTEAAGTYADKLSVYTLENTVEAQRDRINNLDTNKADKTQIITVTSGTGTLFLADDGTYKPAAGDPPDLSAYLTKTEAAGEYATKTELAGKADAADIPDVSGFETTAHAAETYATKTELTEGLATKADATAIADMLTKTEAAGTYADKVSVLTLENTVDAQGTSIRNLADTKADKSEIPDVSGFETTAHAAETYATKTELSTGLASKADTDQIITITTGDGTKYLADDGSYKTLTIPVVDSTLIPDSPNPVSNAAVVTGFATYGTQIEQLNAQVVANAEAIEGLESSKADVSDIPDVSGFETTAHAEATYATKTELDAKADRTQLQGYLTKMEASETYETIARASKIKSITAAGHAVTVTDEGLANVGGTKVTKASTSPQIGVSDVSIAVQQILPATEEATTGEGETLPITYTSTTSGALTSYSNFTIDGVPIATKDDLTASESPIKSLAVATLSGPPYNWYTPITVDANGLGQLGGTCVIAGEVPDQPGETVHSTAVQYLEPNVTPTYNSSGYGFNFIFRKKTSDTYYPTMEVNTFTRDGTYRFGKTIPTKEYVDDVFATKAEIQGMATQTWVQQYIASLDGTNISA